MRCTGVERSGGLEEGDLSPPENQSKLAARLPFACRAGMAGRLRMATLFIEPGTPWENGNNERFNDELSNRAIFYTLEADRGLATRVQHDPSARQPKLLAARTGDVDLRGRRSARMAREVDRSPEAGQERVRGSSAAPPWRADKGGQNAWTDHRLWFRRPQTPAQSA